MTKELENKILDKLDHALSAARQSSPDSLSPILQEIRNKIDLQKQIMDEHVRLHGINDKKWDEALIRMEPILKESEDARKFKEDVDKKATKLTKWGTRWLVLTAIITSIYYGLKHIK